MNDTVGLTLRSLLIMEEHSPGNGYQQLLACEVDSSVRFIVYVVLNYNDGTLIEIDKVEQVIGELVKFAKGGTITPPGLGWWVNPKTNGLCQDKVMVVDVTIPASLFLKAVLFIPRWIKRTKKLLRQSEVFVIGQSVWYSWPQSQDHKS